MIEFDLLAEIVEELTGVTKEELVSKKRHRTLVELRMACSVILRDYSQRTGQKLTVFEIGEILNIDHSSVSYYSITHYKLVADFNSKNNRNYRVLYEQLKSSFDIKSLFLKKDKKRILLEKRALLENEIKLINKMLFVIEEAQ